ncbi:hypothetical protein [Deinococcus maricopensis]|uniref:Uncharacterized protein n=1 Tax=Deinococcus maricopensis (strain DSM 21211 / LMG 22137 / NRRL B-23946 / LB-34) TaxID=709986 RepID=E8U3C6_DEIML|nr:hypothetical protein [Deinococcus maricopensis]ADV65797.1 hypothetical protein Deima_0133 [Deinococcus maricopensis DSM 21211]
MPARPWPTPHAYVDAATCGVALGYVLDGAPYALARPPGVPDALLIARHAHTLGYTHVHLRGLPTEPLPLTLPAPVTWLPGPPADRAAHLARLADALATIVHGQPLTPEQHHALQASHTPSADGRTLIHVDGSFALTDDLTGIGYTLNGVPFAITAARAEHPNGAHAEREAIRVALMHAATHPHATLHVQSDHVFHVRRYAEDLVHRGRRKSSSLERLDALADALRPRLHFMYAPTLDLHAPHRLAVHARALATLARGAPLTRAQQVAVRRVHFALRSATPVPY